MKAKRSLSLAAKVTIMVLIAIIGSTASIGIISYLIYRNSSIQSNSDRVLAISQSVAAMIDPAEFRQIMETMEKNEYHRSLEQGLSRIKTSIDKITKSTASVLERFEAIDGNVKTVSLQEEIIRNAMEEQSRGSRQVLEALKILNEITKQVENGSNGIYENSKQVIHESESLEQITHEISSSMNEISSGTNRIDETVNHVNELSTMNSVSIDLLVKEVSWIKVGEDT